MFGEHPYHDDPLYRFQFEAKDLKEEFEFIHFADEDVYLSKKDVVDYKTKNKIAREIQNLIRSI